MSDKFSVYTLDVLGNYENGYEVNDRCKVGSVELAPDWKDAEVWAELVQAGIAKGPFEKAKFEWQDHDSCYINRKSDGKPLFDLQKD